MEVYIEDAESYRKAKLKKIYITCRSQTGNINQMETNSLPQQIDAAFKYTQKNRNLAV